MPLFTLQIKEAIFLGLAFGHVSWEFFCLAKVTGLERSNVCLENVKQSDTDVKVNPWFLD